jgi:hypothetical protein
MPDALFPFVAANARAMMFVDGENLSIRHAAMVRAVVDAGRERVGVPGGIWEDPEVAVWAQTLIPAYGGLPGGMIFLRKHYYTSVQGDENRRAQVEQWLKEHSFEAPRVFPRDKNGRSKQVDIMLATEMLTHAHRRHYDFAVLVAGDADYIPLVRAAKGEGARVHIWALSSGLSPKLKMEADHFASLDDYLRV